MGKTLYKAKIKATFKVDLNVAFNMVGAGGFASRGLKNSPQDCFLPTADG